MFLADVIGTVVTPVQVPTLDGRPQLLVRPLSPTGAALGRARIALDNVGCTVGDRVLVIDEGNSGRQLVPHPQGAVKTVVVGVVDYVELDGRHVYDHGARAPVERRSP